MWLCWQSTYVALRSREFSPLHSTRWVLWHLPILPALERKRRSKKSMVISGYIEISKLAWDICDPISKTHD